MPLLNVHSCWVCWLMREDINEGSSTGAVNFPEVSLRSITIEEENHARVCVVHHNMAGALREFNRIFSELDINVDKQFSDSRYIRRYNRAYFVGETWRT